uniref:Uncharacterized protein LOC116953532 n=1 Tax=Petromyzon marinus TaxID=7757 RepID=A0AAJ7XCU0_PETMA|nr:uncharacterized protein LOC116953532 [Petromyzon marinus]
MHIGGAGEGQQTKQCIFLHIYWAFSRVRHLQGRVRQVSEIPPAPPPQSTQQNALGTSAVSRWSGGVRRSICRVLPTHSEEVWLCTVQKKFQIRTCPHLRLARFGYVRCESSSKDMHTNPFYIIDAAIPMFGARIFPEEWTPSSVSGSGGGGGGGGGRGIRGSGGVDRSDETTELQELTPLKKDEGGEGSVANEWGSDDGRSVDEGEKPPAEERAGEEEAEEEDSSLSKKLLVKEFVLMKKAQMLADMVQDDHRKKHQMQRSLKISREDYKDVDHSKMSMRQLLYWIPSNNPMLSTLKEEKEKVVAKERENHLSDRAVAVPPRPECPVTEADGVDDDDDDGDDGDEGLMVPRVRVGEDGTLILDNESLTVRVRRPGEDDAGVAAALAVEALREDGSSARYSNFSKHVATRRWSDMETELYFLAISMVGTDMSMVSHLFPTRSRHELKNKFKRESRIHPWRIDKACMEKKPMDMEGFAKLLADEEEERKKKKAKKKTRKRRAKPSDDDDEEEEEEGGLSGVEHDDGGGEDPACDEGSRTKTKRQRRSGAREESDGGPREVTAEEVGSAAPSGTPAAKRKRRRRRARKMSKRKDGGGDDSGRAASGDGVDGPLAPEGGSVGTGGGDDDAASSETVPGRGCEVRAGVAEKKTRKRRRRRNNEEEEEEQKETDGKAAQEKKKVTKSKKMKVKNDHGHRDGDGQEEPAPDFTWYDPSAPDCNGTDRTNAAEKENGDPGAAGQPSTDPGAEVAEPLSVGTAVGPRRGGRGARGGRRSRGRGGRGGRGGGKGKDVARIVTEAVPRESCSTPDAAVAVAAAAAGDDHDAEAEVLSGEHRGGERDGVDAQIAGTSPAGSSAGDAGRGAGGSPRGDDSVAGDSEHVRPGGGRGEPWENPPPSRVRLCIHWTSFAPYVANRVNRRCGVYRRALQKPEATELPWRAPPTARGFLPRHSPTLRSWRRAAVASPMRRRGCGGRRGGRSRASGRRCGAQPFDAGGGREEDRRRPTTVERGPRPLGLHGRRLARRRTSRGRRKGRRRRRRAGSALQTHARLRRTSPLAGLP